MKKKLLLLVLSFALCLPTFAESMCVNLRNGETVSFNLEDVKDVTICETLPLIIDSVVDESETPLKFKILSDSTLEVIKDDSYKELDSVSIPAKVRIDGKVYDVTSIGSKAFYFCENLTKATIPSSITNINDEAFFECPYLEALIDNSNGIIYMGNTVFSSKNSVKYTHPEYLVDDRLKFVIMTDSTVGVGLLNSPDYAWNPLGESIDIPTTVKISGKMYTVVSIIPGAFAYSSMLESFEFPPTITSIGARAFSYCTNLKSIKIPSGVTILEEETFMGCIKLDSIEIPESVTYIGDRVFAKDDSLNIVINNSKENIRIKKNALRNCHNFGCEYSCKSVTYLKESTVATDTTILRESSTIYSYKILSDSTVEINGHRGQYPLDMTGIKEAVFPEKVKIEDAYYENEYQVYTVTGVSDYLFSNCNRLISVKIPNSFTSIGEASFLNCPNLTSIEIPSSVINIGKLAFSNCENLDVVIDNSKDNVIVGEDAFKDCKSVKYLK